MTRKFLFIFVLALVLSCSAATFFGLFFMGAVGGTMMGVAPQTTFSLIRPYICPDGSQVAYETIQQSYHKPGEGIPLVECVAVDGERTDVTVTAISKALGLSFLIGFILAFIVLFIVIIIIAYAFPPLFERLIVKFKNRIKR